MNIQTASDNLTKTLIYSLRDNGYPIELDGGLNAASTDVIEAFGVGCWLGLVNLYTDQNPIWQWDGDHVYNFAADFVLPEFDQTLHDLILERKSREYTNTSDDAKLVDAILDRIKTIGGVNLYWS